MPAPVDAGFAQWLRDAALYTKWNNATLLAGLQGMAVEQEIISPFATLAAADAEAARQGAFLGAGLAVDEHIVKGQRRDLLAKPITLIGDNLGYAGAGAVGFVIGYEELENQTTRLQVLKKMV